MPLRHCAKRLLEPSIEKFSVAVLVLLAALSSTIAEPGGPWQLAAGGTVMVPDGFGWD